MSYSDEKRIAKLNRKLSMKKKDDFLDAAKRKKAEARRRDSNLKWQKSGFVKNV